MANGGASFSSPKELVLALLGSLDEKERAAVVKALGENEQAPCERVGHKGSKPTLVTWLEHRWGPFRWGRALYANVYTCTACSYTWSVQLQEPANTGRR